MLAELLRWDIDLFWLINSRHTALADTFFLIITNLGNFWIMLPVLAGIIVWKTPRPQLRRALVFAAISLSLTGIITVTMKQTICRPRPLGYFVTKAQPPEAPVQPRFWGSFATTRPVHVAGPRLRYRSFPSGHTSGAFAFAVLMIALFGRWYWLTLIPAVLVALSRVYLGVHFPLDTMVGAFVGSAAIVVTLLFYRPAPSAGGKKPATVVEKIAV
jgi:undecaprenyl-diphosphatase